jgi:hypothetical protein
LQFINKLLFFSSSVFVILILDSQIIFPNQAIAAGKFTINAKIKLKILNNPQKLKVVAFSNGENKTKI